MVEVSLNIKRNFNSNHFILINKKFLFLLCQHFHYKKILQRSYFNEKFVRFRYRKTCNLWPNWIDS